MIMLIFVSSFTLKKRRFVKVYTVTILYTAVVMCCLALELSTMQLMRKYLHSNRTLED